MFRLPVVTSPGLWIQRWSTPWFRPADHLAVQRVIHRMDWLDALKVQE